LKGAPRQRRQVRVRRKRLRRNREARPDRRHVHDERVRIAILIERAVMVWLAGGGLSVSRVQAGFDAIGCRRGGAIARVVPDVHRFAVLGADGVLHGGEVNRPRELERDAARDRDRKKRAIQQPTRSRRNWKACAKRKPCHGVSWWHAVRAAANGAISITRLAD